MSYKLTFGNFSEPRYLIILTEADMGEIGTPQEIVGDNASVNLRFDADKNSIGASVIKTSLEVSLIRENDSDFADILDSSDDEVEAFLTTSEPIFDSAVNLVFRFTAMPFTGAMPRMLFRGTLSIQTWSEAYLPHTTIKLTFHDKLGVLDSVPFVPMNRYMNFKDIVETCVIDHVSADQYLMIDWPYRYAETKDYAENLYIDVAEQIGKSKGAVLSQLMKDFKMQAVMDYGLQITDGMAGNYTNVNNFGGIRVRSIYNLSRPTSLQSIYEKETKQINSYGTLKNVNTYTLSLVESVQTGGVLSTLTVYYGTGPAKGTDPAIILKFSTNGINYFIVRDYLAEEGNSTLSSAQKTFFGISGTDEYVNIHDGLQEALRYINVLKIEAALKLLIIWRYDIQLDGYTITCTAKSASAGYDINVISYSYLHVGGYASSQDYSSDTIVVASGKFVEPRTEHIITATNKEIVNRSGGFTLDMKAKHVASIVNYGIQNNTIFPFDYSKDYRVNINGVSIAMNTYELTSSSETNLDSIFLQWANGGSLRHGCRVEVVNRKESLKIRLEETAGTYMQSVIGSCICEKSSASTLSLTFTANRLVDINANLYVCLVARQGDKIFQFMQKDPYTTGDSWDWTWNFDSTDLDDYDWYDFGLSYVPWFLRLHFAKDIGGVDDVEIGEELTFTRNNIPHPTEFTNDEYELFAIAVPTGCDIYINNFELGYNSNVGYPTSLRVVNQINPKNRQTVEETSAFSTLPDIEGAGMVYLNGLFKDDFTRLATIQHKKYAVLPIGAVEFWESATLMVHGLNTLSMNYAVTRWNLRSTIYIEYFRMHDIFTLDGRSFIVQSGSYDVKRGYLSGVFVEHVIFGRVPAWNWEDGTAVLWESGEPMLEQN